jgi:hypothetical protein
MSLVRTPHWATREFHNHLRDSAKKPFKWGEWDCCLSAASAIESFTGTDIADDFRGKYTDEDTAFALIKEVTGGSTVADAAAYCAEKYGLTEYKFPLMAKRGDLVVAANGDTLIAACVHLNGRHIVSVSERGLVRLPITKITRSWSVS